MMFGIALATFVFLQFFFDVLASKCLQSVMSKERAVQIEYRTYCVSLVHALVVVPLAYFGLFVAW